MVTARVDAPGSVRFASYLGKREYPHCTSAGKALLATLPSEQARALALEAGMPVRTERTITDPDALLRDLELSAARGYTIDDEEDSEGVFCVGAAIFDRNGERVAAITGTGLKLNRPTWRMDELGLTIRVAADQITVALGGPPFAARQSGWPAGPAAVHDRPPTVPVRIGALNARREIRALRDREQSASVPGRRIVSSRPWC